MFLYNVQSATFIQCHQKCVLLWTSPKNKSVKIKTSQFPIAVLQTNVSWCLQEWRSSGLSWCLLGHVLSNFIRSNQCFYSSSSVSSVKSSAKSATVNTEASDCFMEELVWLWEKIAHGHQRKNQCNQSVCTEDRAHCSDLKPSRKTHLLSRKTHIHISYCSCTF